MNIGNLWVAQALDYIVFKPDLTSYEDLATVLSISACTNSVGTYTESDKALCVRVWQHEIRHSPKT